MPDDAPRNRRRLGVLTGGGDAPGLNPAIRAVVLAAHGLGLDCLGIEDGFEGLRPPSRVRPLTPALVDDLVDRGGTILGTTNTGNPFSGSGRADATTSVETARLLGLDAIIAIGGDGTMEIAHRFGELGLPIVGVPKTIDNDLAGTDATCGFATAVDVTAAAIARLRSSAESHHRLMAVEVMGHHSGWLALHAAIAGGADVVLIPEVAFDPSIIAAHVERRAASGQHFSVVVAADESRAAHGELADPPEMSARLRNVAARLAALLEALTGKTARHSVLGHLQRGGDPSPLDRVLASRLGTFAVSLAARGEHGVLAATRGPDIVAVPIAEVVGKRRTVPLDGDLIATARSLGMCLGDR